MAAADLTAARLRELLDYSQDTGLFRWRNALAGHHAAGDVAGCNSRGYLVIGIDRSIHRAHRLAWLYTTGEWPKQHIDHIDGNKSNNRLANLRDVCRNVNLQNRHRADADNRNGALGVCRQSYGAWRAEICAFGKRHYLGTFTAKEDAHAAYLAAKQRLHVDAPIAAKAGEPPPPLGHRIGRSGIRGVKQMGNKWRAFLHTKTGQKHLGLFSTPEEAAEAYAAAKRLYDAQGNVDSKALLGHKTERMGALYSDTRDDAPTLVSVG